MKETSEYDVIIVGGSYAGLSAAMALGRSLRKVLILDTGKPCNAQTPHSHNFITQDGETPANIAKQAREQVLQYPTIQLLHAKATQATQSDHFIHISTENGETFTAKKVLFATGIIDLMPEIPGFAECWGISVLHCPYCHGYEVRGEKTGLLANGDLGFELAKLIHHWSQDVILFTNGRSTLSNEQIEKLKSKNIPIVETEISRIEHRNGQVKMLHLKDGSTHPVAAIYARIGFQQHCDLPQTLGCELTTLGHVKVDEFGKTNVPHVFVAGDATTPLRSVAAAVAAGNKAAAWMNKELIDERF